MSSPNDTTTMTIAPPELPRHNDVDKEVALKYLDAYNAYVAAYVQRGRPGSDKADVPEQPSRESSVAPSMSASQTGPSVPRVVRTDSRSSILTYTPPDPASAYPGLIPDSGVDEDGYCYLALVKHDAREYVKERLGAYPRFLDIMMMDRRHFLDVESMARLQISRTSLGHYHVLTGTIMPNAVSTLAVVAQGLHVEDLPDTTVYHWARGIVPRAGLTSAPAPEDVLGSRRQRPRHTGTWYDYANVQQPAYVSTSSSSQYTYPDGSTYSSQTHVYTPTIVYREPRPSSREQSQRRDSGGGHRATIGGAERRRERRSITADTTASDGRRVIHRSPRDSYTAEDEMPPITYDMSELQQEIDDIWRWRAPSSLVPRTSSGAQESTVLSSNASSCSVKVHGSLQGIECAICREVIGEGAGFLTCGHVFHSSCVDPWLYSHETCPTCRKRNA